MNDKSINKYSTIKWMARLAASDGVMASAERKVLTKFAATYILDTSKIIRLAYGFSNDFDKQVEVVDPNERKGREFEAFVVSLCSDKSRISVLAWRGDKNSGDTYALENRLPDLHLRHRLDAAEVEYLVECKYRSSLPDGVLDLTDQLSRYRRLGSVGLNSEVFIALSIGGTPSNPEQLYIIPSRMIKRDAIIKVANFEKCLCPLPPQRLPPIHQSLLQ